MARKFRLNPDELLVDSFETVKLEGEGTVFAQETERFSESTCHQLMCTCTFGGPENGTCDISCAGNCQPTYLNCNGCGGSVGCSGAETCGCPQSNHETCCTGHQLECSRPW